jgi:pyruvate,orthophosphate dikinase
VAEAALPEVFREFRAVAGALEDLYGDAVDIEFTVETGTLYLLQVRAAKRSAQAAIRIAADFLREERVKPAVALGRVSPAQVRQVDRPGFDDAAVRRARTGGGLLGAGIGASPGQVAGIAVLDPDRAVQMANRPEGRSVILMRPTTSPLDLHGMIAALGIVTSLGGATSHAAVVARALDKPCVVGCAALEIDLDLRRFGIDGRWFDEGTPISIDGASGEIFAGAIPMVSGEATTADLSKLLAVADEAARCRIYGRATTVEQVRRVLERGGSGIATRVGDVLATSGRLDELVALLVSQRDAERVDMQGFDAVIADIFAPLLEAAGAAPFAVRAIDFMADEAMELLDSTTLFAQCPRLALPLGVPELIGAQIAGLGAAVRRVGYPGIAHLTVRHVVDPSETNELRRIAETESSRSQRRLPVGATLTSLRGVQLASEMARNVDVIWLEIRGLQSALFGYPARILLTGEPLDGYIQRRLISTDPRDALDPSMMQVIASVGTARMRNPRCMFGIRLAGRVSEELAAAVFCSGFRVVAVDAEEVRPARLAFGKAALADV